MLEGDAGLGTNRGVALLGGKMFFVTDNAHLSRSIARRAAAVGRPMPPSEPDERHPTAAPIAPLVVHDMVVAGVAGADHGIRGFVAAYDPGYRRPRVARLGRPASRRARQSKRGRASEPLSAGAPPGSPARYDASTRHPLLGHRQSLAGFRRPRPAAATTCTPIACSRCDARQDRRTQVALPVHAARLKRSRCHRAQRPGRHRPTRARPRNSSLHADRNGFFYVLDRTNGKVLSAKPFLRRVDWASSHRARRQPVVTNPQGCPSDAANWDSTA